MNLRRNTKSFIKLVYDKELKDIQDRSEARARIQNVAWPSESLATLPESIHVGDCGRSMFYKILGVTPTNPMTVRSRHICDAGNLYEDYHIKKFKELGMYEDDQISIEFKIPDGKNDVLVCGKMDVIISDNGKLKAIEIKTVSAWKAPSTMGDIRTQPLPATKNLMQVMLYLYYLNNTEKGQALGIDEVYLMYINRSDNSIFYYRVELDVLGYAVITAIDQSGKKLYTLNLRDVPGYDELLASPEVASSYSARLAELKIRVQDIFSRFDSVYTLATQKILPPNDYTLSYSPDELEKQFKCGRISKVKYNKATKKGEQIGDFQCTYCAFFQKCLAESGIIFK